MIIVAIILGGFVVGFMAGASQVPTGGNVASAVMGLFLGAFSSKAAFENVGKGNLDEIGKFITIFLISLLISYIVSNILRQKGFLLWMLDKTKTKKRKGR